MHDAAGKKIMHPADAIRRKAKKKKLEKMKGSRHKHFEEKMLQRSPEDILLEIRQLKADHDRKTRARIEITKAQLDRLKQLEVGYERMKEQVEEEHNKRKAEPKSSLYVDFDELKIHRKSSVFYHPVNNPYGAPPTGQTLMYNHPDGSVKREPPPLPAKSAPKADGDAAMGRGADDSDDSGSSGSEDESEDDGADPMLPDSLPGVTIAASSSEPIGATMPPLPPGAPPLPAGQPPLPGGPPPLPLGQPPLPFGQAPLPFGQPPLPFGQPPLPFGQPLLGQPPVPFGGLAPFGQPPLPMGAVPGGDMSQAAFMAELSQAGFQLPGLPPGPPPKPASPAPTTLASVGRAPPGPPPKKPQPKKVEPKKAEPARAESPPRQATAVSELPAGAKAPPPPPKKPAGPAPAALRAATAFMPTTLRTKKPSQVAGGVMQATSSSLSMAKRQNLISTEVPRVSDPVNMDDAFNDFMRDLGNT